MQLKLRDFLLVNAQALFNPSDTVTIQIFDIDGNDVTPANPGNECSELGGIGTTGIFRWPYANLVTPPDAYAEFVWIMTNQLGDTQIDVDSFTPEDPNTVVHIPFDIDVKKVGINKGDSFETEFRIETNSVDSEVRVEFSDGVTSESTTINKATSNVTGGGIDQVKLIAFDIDGSFVIYRVYLSSAETASFDTTRHLDMKVTLTTPDSKVFTRKYKIPFTETPALTYDTVP